MTLRSTLVSAGLGLAFVAVIAPGLQPGGMSSVPEVRDSAKPPAFAAARAAAPSRPQELTRAPDGHFYAEADVNGAQIRFLVDTGASFVALTPADAQRAGISHGWTRAEAMGAGGRLEVSPVTIDRMSLGSVSVSRVSGAVIDDLPVSLLGQSFLSQVGSVEIQGDRMVMR